MPPPRVRAAATPLHPLLPRPAQQLKGRPGLRIPPTGKTLCLGLECLEHSGPWILLISTTWRLRSTRSVTVPTAVAPVWDLFVGRPWASAHVPVSWVSFQGPRGPLTPRSRALHLLLGT